jgi:hypothetical protein
MSTSSRKAALGSSSHWRPSPHCMPCRGGEGFSFVLLCIGFIWCISYCLLVSVIHLLYSLSFILLTSRSDDYVSSVLAKPQYSRRLHDVFVKSFDENLDFFCNLVPSFYKMIKSKDLILSLFDIGFFSVLLERVKYFYKLLAVSKNRSRNDVCSLLCTFTLLRLIIRYFCSCFN